jgi:hypothetical protein
VFQSLRSLERWAPRRRTGVLFLSAPLRQRGTGGRTRRAARADGARDAQAVESQVDRWIEAERRAAGFVTIAADGGVREIYRTLRSNGVVSMLGDRTRATVCSCRSSAG